PREERRQCAAQLPHPRLALRDRLGRIVAFRHPERGWAPVRRDLPGPDLDLHLRGHRQNHRGLALPRPLPQHRRVCEPRLVRRLLTMACISHFTNSLRWLAALINWPLTYLWMGSVGMTLCTSSFPLTIIISTLRTRSITTVTTSWVVLFWRVRTTTDTTTSN